MLHGLFGTQFPMSLYPFQVNYGFCQIHQGCVVVGVTPKPAYWWALGTECAPRLKLQSCKMVIQLTHHLQRNGLF